MKIICKGEYNARETLQFIAEYIEKKYPKFPFIEKTLEIEISLKNSDGVSCPENKETNYLEEKDIKISGKMDQVSENYYNKDILTGIYNRHKYEKDILMFQEIGYSSMTCVYIDAVGLHEINNHLGHKAGDAMLCVIADEIQKNFPNDLFYRIGGDEFIILCPEQRKEEIQKKTDLLKQEIRQCGYEISAGISENTNSKTLNKAIDVAENSMRNDKMKFYQGHGRLRQMRSLNYELEKLLIEKQDASHFLNVIAPQYKGVYIVNTEEDTCRYIYVPLYFQKMLDKHAGLFSAAMEDYYHTLVLPKYHILFEKIFDYNHVETQLVSGNTVGFVYQKRDGTFIELKITMYDEECSDGKEMLWIFCEK